MRLVYILDSFTGKFLRFEKNLEKRHIVIKIRKNQYKLHTPLTISENQIYYIKAKMKTFFLEINEILVLIYHHFKTLIDRFAQ